MANESVKKLVARHKRLAFMKTADGVYTRMTGFTSLGESKEAKEYSRQYVDEATERADVVGYATGISYEFDRHTNTSVHDILATVSDDEVVGTDAQVEVVSVDLFNEGVNGAYTARLRTYSVIPDGSGDGTDALIYKGTLKAASEITYGTASSSDNWQTCTFSKKDSTGEEIS